MPVYYEVNGSLLPEGAYLALRSESSGSTSRSVRTDANRSMLRVAMAGASWSDSKPREFTPIGLGKPLTMWITSAYSGDAPPKRGRNKGGLLSSAVKSWSYNDAKPRALNALNRHVAKNAEFQIAANEPGTPIAFYSPAVVDRQLISTFEMAFDNVNEDFYSGIGNIMSSASALPVFASAAPYLLALGTLFRIGAKIANSIYDSKAEFVAVAPLDIHLPGTNIEAGYRLVTRSAIEYQLLMKDYHVVEGKLVSKATPAKAYDGPEPYVVVALDGMPDPSLEGFAASAASAALLERFYNVRENGETSADAFVQALKLFNDFRYSREALDLKKRLDNSGLTPEEKAQFEARLAAVVKNILTDEFKPKP